MLIAAIVTGTVIATKYIIGLIIGSTVVGAGTGASVVHLLKKRQGPDSIDLERQSRQQSREEELDTILQDTEKRLDQTLQGFSNNSKEVSSTVFHLKQIFADAAQKIKELSQVSKSIKESEIKRLKELEKTQIELLSEINVLKEQLSRAEKSRGELQDELTKMSQQLEHSASTLVVKGKEVMELRHLYEKKTEENKKLSDAYLEMNQLNGELEQELKSTFELLQQGKNRTQNSQEELKTSHPNSFF